MYFLGVHLLLSVLCKLCILLYTLLCAALDLIPDSVDQTTRLASNPECYYLLNTAQVNEWHTTNSYITLMQKYSHTRVQNVHAHILVNLKEN